MIFDKNGSKIQVDYEFKELQISIAFPCKFLIQIFSNYETSEMKIINFPQIEQKNTFKNAVLIFPLQENIVKIFVYIQTNTGIKNAGFIKFDVYNAISKGTNEMSLILENCPDKNATLKFDFEYKKMTEIIDSAQNSSKKNMKKSFVNENVIEELILPDTNKSQIAQNSTQKSAYKRTEAISQELTRYITGVPSKVQKNLLKSNLKDSSEQVSRLIINSPSIFKGEKISQRIEFIDRPVERHVEFNEIERIIQKYGRQNDNKSPDFEVNANQKFKMYDLSPSKNKKTRKEDKSREKRPQIQVQVQQGLFPKGGMHNSTFNSNIVFNLDNSNDDLHKMIKPFEQNPVFQEKIKMTSTQNPQESKSKSNLLQSRLPTNLLKNSSPDVKKDFNFDTTNLILRKDSRVEEIDGKLKTFDRNFNTSRSLIKKFDPIEFSPQGPFAIRVKEKQISELKDELAKEKETNLVLRQEINLKKPIISNLEKKIHETGKQLTFLKDENKNLNIQITNLQNELQERISELNFIEEDQRLKELDIDREKAVFTEQIQKLKLMIESLYDNRDSRQKGSQLKSNEAFFNGNPSPKFGTESPGQNDDELKKLNEVILNLTNKLETKNNIVDSFMSDSSGIFRFTDQKHDNNQNEEKKQQNIEKKQDENFPLKVENETLKNNIDNIKQEYQFISETLQKTKNELDSMLIDKFEYNTKIQLLEHDLDLQVKECQNKNIEIDRLEQIIEENKKEKHNVEESISALQYEIEVLEEQIDFKEKEVIFEKEKNKKVEQNFIESKKRCDFLEKEVEFMNIQQEELQSQKMDLIQKIDNLFDEKTLQISNVKEMHEKAIFEKENIENLKNSLENQIVLLKNQNNELFESLNIHKRKSGEMESLLNLQLKKGLIDIGLQTDLEQTPFQHDEVQSFLEKIKFLEEQHFSTTFEKKQLKIENEIVKLQLKEKLDEKLNLIEKINEIELKSVENENILKQKNENHCSKIESLENIFISTFLDSRVNEMMNQMNNNEKFYQIEQEMNNFVDLSKRKIKSAQNDIFLLENEKKNIIRECDHFRFLFADSYVDSISDNEISNIKLKKVELQLSNCRIKLKTQTNLFENAQNELKMEKFKNQEEIQSNIQQLLSENTLKEEKITLLENFVKNKNKKISDILLKIDAKNIKKTDLIKFIIDKIINLSSFFNQQILSFSQIMESIKSKNSLQSRHFNQLLLENSKNKSKIENMKIFVSEKISQSKILKQQIHDLSNDIEKSKNELESTFNQTSILQQKLSENEKILESTKQENKNLSTKIDDLIFEYDAKLKISKEEYNILSQQKIDIQNLLQTTISEYELKNNELNNSLEIINVEKQNLKNIFSEQIIKLENELESINLDKNSANNEIKNQSILISSLENEKTNVQNDLLNEIEKLNEKINEKTFEIEKKTLAISQNIKILEKSDLKISELESYIKILKTDVDVNKTSVNYQDKRIIELEILNNDFITEKNKMENNVLDLKKVEKALNDAVLRGEDENKMLLSKNESIENKFKKLIEGMEEEKLLLINEINYYKSQISNLNEVLLKENNLKEDLIKNVDEKDNSWKKSLEMINRLQLSDEQHVINFDKNMAEIEKLKNEAKINEALNDKLLKVEKINGTLNDQLNKNQEMNKTLDEKLLKEEKTNETLNDQLLKNKEMNKTLNEKLLKEEKTNETLNDQLLKSEENVKKLEINNEEKVKLLGINKNLQSELLIEQENNLNLKKSHDNILKQCQNDHINKIELIEKTSKLTDIELKLEEMSNKVKDYDKISNQLIDLTNKLKEYDIISSQLIETKNQLQVLQNNKNTLELEKNEKCQNIKIIEDKNETLKQENNNLNQQIQSQIEFEQSISKLVLEITNFGQNKKEINNKYSKLKNKLVKIQSIDKSGDLLKESFEKVIETSYQLKIDNLQFNENLLKASSFEQTTYDLRTKISDCEKIITELEKQNSSNSELLLNFDDCQNKLKSLQNEFEKQSNELLIVRKELSEKIKNQELEINSKIKFISEQEALIVSLNEDISNLKKDCIERSNKEALNFEGLINEKLLSIQTLNDKVEKLIAENRKQENDISLIKSQNHKKMCDLEENNKNAILKFELELKNVISEKNNKIDEIQQKMNESDKLYKTTISEMKNQLKIETNRLNIELNNEKENIKSKIQENDKIIAKIENDWKAKFEFKENELQKQLANNVKITEDSKKESNQIELLWKEQNLKKKEELEFLSKKIENLENEKKLKNTKIEESFNKNEELSNILNEKTSEINLLKTNISKISENLITCEKNNKLQEEQIKTKIQEMINSSKQNELSAQKHTELKQEYEKIKNLLENNKKSLKTETDNSLLKNSEIEKLTHKIDFEQKRHENTLQEIISKNKQEITSIIQTQNQKTHEFEQNIKHLEQMNKEIKAQFDDLAAKESEVRSKAIKSISERKSTTAKKCRQFKQNY